MGGDDAAGGGDSTGRGPGAGKGSHSQRSRALLTEQQALAIYNSRLNTAADGGRSSRALAWQYGVSCPTSISAGVSREWQWTNLEQTGRTCSQHGACPDGAAHGRGGAGQSGGRWGSKSASEKTACAHAPAEASCLLGERGAGQAPAPPVRAQGQHTWPRIAAFDRDPQI